MAVETAADLGGANGKPEGEMAEKQDVDFSRIGEAYDTIERFMEGLEAGQVGDTAASAAEAIDLYRGSAAYAKECKAIWDSMAARAKKVLGEIIVETGQTSWEGKLGKCFIPAAGISVRYDSKLLDRECVLDPQLAARLAPFRIEKAREGSLTIR